MASPTTRSYVRHAGDHDAEWLAEREAIAAEDREALEARQAAFRAEHPRIADRMAVRRSRRYR